MKNLFLVVVVLYCQLAIGQIKIQQYDKECFLIGSLDDYMGHQQTFTKSADSFYYQMVDIYYQQEIKKVLLIDSLFKGEHLDLYIDNNGAPKGIKMYSSTLSKKIDQYYNYKPSGRYTIAHDTIYTGYFKEDLLRTNEQKLSFLAGVFFRVGVKAGEKEHVIHIPNSVSKAKSCANLLKEFGCENVQYKIMTGSIPVGHSVVFEPSEKIREIIEDVQSFDKPNP